MIDRDFYEQHKNFTLRTSSDYYLSPGIRCKFDLILKNLITNKEFVNSLELGCSGDSFLYFYNKSYHISLLDLASSPLKQYLPIKIRYQKDFIRFNLHPLSADSVNLPYKEKQFDLVIALDVLEHIKDDLSAIKEISRVLEKNGIVLITVPHRKKYYTQQDKLIGHYRRYEINELKKKFQEHNLKTIKKFGIYGQLMQISEIQGVSPEKTERNLIRLRERYEKNEIFRKFWNKFVKLTSILMKIDASYLPLKRAMNIAMIFRKTI